MLKMGNELFPLTARLAAPGPVIATLFTSAGKALSKVMVEGSGNVKLITAGAGGADMHSGGVARGVLTALIASRNEHSPSAGVFESFVVSTVSASAVLHKQRPIMALAIILFQRCVFIDVLLVNDQ